MPGAVSRQAHPPVPEVRLVGRCLPVPGPARTDHLVRNRRRPQALPGLAGKTECRRNDVGEPCAGKPHARFDAAGAGNGAPAMVIAVKRPAGESRGKVTAGPNVRNRHRASPRPYIRVDGWRRAPAGPVCGRDFSVGVGQRPGCRAGWPEVPRAPRFSFLGRRDGLCWSGARGSASIRCHAAVIASAHGQLAWIFRRRRRPPRTRTGRGIQHSVPQCFGSALARSPSSASNLTRRAGSARSSRRSATRR